MSLTVVKINEFKTLLNEVIGAKSVGCVSMDLRQVRFFIYLDLRKLSARVASRLILIRVVNLTKIYRFFRLTHEVISVSSFDNNQWEIDLHSWTIKLGVMGLRYDWVLLRWLRKHGWKGMNWLCSIVLQEILRCLLIHGRRIDLYLIWSLIYL